MPIPSQRQNPIVQKYNPSSFGKLYPRRAQLLVVDTNLRNISKILEDAAKLFKPNLDLPQRILLKKTAKIQQRK
jgi:hypothetical protein